MKEFVGGLLFGFAMTVIAVFAGTACYCSCCEHHAACETKCKPCVCPSPVIPKIGAAAE